MDIPLRGEFTIELGPEGHRRSFKMRPSFSAMSRMEKVLGVGLFTFINSAIIISKDGKIGPNLDQFTLSNVVTIIWHGIAGGWDSKDRVPSIDEIGDLIVATGYTKLLTDCIKLVSAAATGKFPEDVDPKGNV